MWWFVGVICVAVLVFAWALCVAASRADASAESWHIRSERHKRDGDE